MDEAHVRVGRAIGMAWEHKDMSVLRAVLANPTEWHETARDEPLVSPGAVIALWQKDLAKQSNISVRVTCMNVIGNRSYQYCEASWDDTERGHVRADALWCIELNGHGKLASMKQWWNSY